MSSKVGMIRKPVTLRAVTLSLFTLLHNQLPGSNLGRIQRYPQDERRWGGVGREIESRLECAAGSGSILFFTVAFVP